MSFKGHTLEVYCAAYLSEMDASVGSNLIVSCGRDRRIRLWDIRTNDCVKTMDGHESTVFSLALLPDHQRIATGSADKTIRLWDIGRGESTTVLHGHAGAVYALEVLPDTDTLISGSEDCSVRVWRHSTNEHTILGTIEDEIWGMGLVDSDFPLCTISKGGEMVSWQL